MKLLADAPTQEEQVQYVFALRNAARRLGRQAPQRLLQLVRHHRAALHGRQQLQGLPQEHQGRCEQTLSAEERVALADVLKAQPRATGAARGGQAAGVREGVEDGGPRSAARARWSPAARSPRVARRSPPSRARTCHKLGNQQADVGLGPDITGVGNRFTTARPARVDPRAVEDGVGPLPDDGDPHRRRRVHRPRRIGRRARTSSSARARSRRR